MGRPAKLTPETHKAIVDALAIGATRKDSALAAGVSFQTFLNWMETGEKAKSGRFFEFFESATKAEGEARLKYTATIATAAKAGDWRAAIEYLSRRDRENWSTRQEVTGILRALIEHGTLISVHFNHGNDIFMFFVVI